MPITTYKIQPKKKEIKVSVNIFKVLLKILEKSDKKPTIYTSKSGIIDYFRVMLGLGKDKNYIRSTVKKNNESYKIQL